MSKRAGTATITDVGVVFAAITGIDVEYPFSPEKRIDTPEALNPDPVIVNWDIGSACIVLREVIVGPSVTARLNVAVTGWLEFIVTAQLPVPEQAPDHPVNVEPVFGVAVSVTLVPVA
jgi:hypothetical protein